MRRLAARPAPCRAVHRLARAGVAALVLFGVVLPAIAAAPPAEGAAGPRTALGACPLPLVHDRYQGFHVGVPPGWSVSSMGGTVEVSRDSSGTEAALIYPALLTRGLTPSRFFAAYTAHQEGAVRRAGGSLSVHILSMKGGLPVASFRLRIDHSVLVGQASVAVEPLRTQLASSLVVYRAWWTPPARLGADRGLLAAIGACYGPEPGTLFRIFRDGVFTYIMPPGWTVGDEGQDNLDLSGLGGGADVSYLLFGIPSGAQGADSPATAIRYIFQRLGIQLTASVATTVLPTTQTTGGATQGQEYLEFTATYHGQPWHGILSCLTDSGGGSPLTTGVMRLGMAAASRWNAVNGGLIQMVGAIQHSFVQDLQEIQTLNQRWQNFSGQVANFDDVLNSQQLVQDPSTGTYYEAPYSSYTTNGPDGPGYYLDNGQRLTPIQRP